MVTDIDVRFMIIIRFYAIILFPLYWFISITGFYQDTICCIFVSYTAIIVIHWYRIHTIGQRLDCILLFNLFATSIKMLFPLHLSPLNTEWITWYTNNQPKQGGESKILRRMNCLLRSIVWFRAFSLRSHSPYHQQQQRQRQQQQSATSHTLAMARRFKYGVVGSFWMCIAILTLCDMKTQQRSWLKENENMQCTSDPRLLHHFFHNYEYQRHQTGIVETTLFTHMIVVALHMTITAALFIDIVAPFVSSRRRSYYFSSLYENTVLIESAFDVYRNNTAAIDEYISKRTYCRGLKFTLSVSLFVVVYSFMAIIWYAIVSQEICMIFTFMCVLSMAVLCILMGGDRHHSRYCFSYLKSTVSRLSIYFYYYIRRRSISRPSEQGKRKGGIQRDTLGCATRAIFARMESLGDRHSMPIRYNDHNFDWDNPYDIQQYRFASLICQHFSQVMESKQIEPRLDGCSFRLLSGRLLLIAAKDGITFHCPRASLSENRFLTSLHMLSVFQRFKLRHHCEAVAFEEFVNVRDSHLDKQFSKVQLLLECLNKWGKKKPVVFRGQNIEFYSLSSDPITKNIDTHGSKIIRIGCDVSIVDVSIFLNRLQKGAN